MRISDWSSDVCSSDLCDPHAPPRRLGGPVIVGGQQREVQDSEREDDQDRSENTELDQNGARFPSPERPQPAAWPKTRYRPDNGPKSEERRVGKECVRTGRVRWETEL